MNAKKPYKFATRAVHAGVVPNPITGAIAPDISVAANYACQFGEIGFSAEGLLRGGNIPPERLSAYAYLEVDGEGELRKIREKPSDVPAVAPGRDILVSMNCWRLTSAFFRACRDVQPSPRGELELPVVRTPEADPSSDERTQTLEQVIEPA